MQKLKPDCAHSATIIGEFIHRHGIEYSRFVRLRSRSPVFENLNERRLRDWAPPSGMSLPHRNPQRSTQAWLAELATWITNDEATLLRALGIKPRLRSIGESTRVNLNPQRPSSAGQLLMAGDIGATAMQQAGQGYSTAAIQLISTAFSRYLAHDIERAMSLLPTTLYLLYRYSSPHEMTQAVTRICRQLKPADIKTSGDPIHRDLSLAQVACALNERGQGVAAGQLFFCPEVRQLSEVPLMGLWPRTQLIRNIAAHWALHGHCASEAMS